MTRLTLSLLILLAGCSAQPAGNATPRSGVQSAHAEKAATSEQAGAGLLSGAPLFGGSAGLPMTTDKPGGVPHPGAEAPVPSPSGEIGTAISSGVASWFAARGDQGAVPWWKPGQEPLWAVVSRFADGHTYSVTVLITGFCQCLVGTDAERVIDLSDGAFAQLAPLSVGLIRVTVELTDAGPGLPATSTEEEGP